MKPANAMPPRVSRVTRSPWVVTSSAKSGTSDCQAFLAMSLKLLPIKNRMATGDVLRQVSCSGMFNNGPGLVEDEDTQLFCNIHAESVDLQITTGTAGGK